MYYNPNAVFRADLNQYVEEAPYRNKGLIGREVLPISGVENRTGHFPRFNRKDTGLFENRVTERAPSGSYGEVQRTWTDQSYTTKDVGIETPVDDTVQADMLRFFNLETMNSKLLGEEIVRYHEGLVAAEIMKEGTPASSTGFAKNDASTEYTEANLATFDVPRDFTKVMEDMVMEGYKPNTMIMTLTTINLLKRSPKLQNYLYPAVSGNTFQRPITNDDIARAFGVERLLVAEAQKEVSKTRGVSTLGPIWSNQYIFFGDIKGGDFQAGGVGRTLTWNKEVPNGFFQTFTYRDERHKSNRIRVSSYFAPHIVDYYAGRLLKLYA
ncbi:hypothetical protein EBZ80_12950 [bacterium]|nr:hypothetical protein [bacterium]